MPATDRFTVLCPVTYVSLLSVGLSSSRQLCSAVFVVLLLHSKLCGALAGQPFHAGWSDNRHAGLVVFGGRAGQVCAASLHWLPQRCVEPVSSELSVRSLFSFHARWRDLMISSGRLHGCSRL